MRNAFPEAIAKITKARAARHLDQLLATVDDWLPTVRQMRPQHDWATVVAKLNEGGRSWRTERLLRAVKLLVAERHRRAEDPRSGLQGMQTLESKAV